MMEMTERQAIEVICTYFKNDFDTITDKLQSECRVPKYLFQMPPLDLIEYQNRTAHIDVFLQNMFLRLSEKEKKSVHNYAVRLKRYIDEEKIMSESALPSQETIQDVSVESSIHKDIMNINTLSELSVYIGDTRTDIHMLITRIESAMMHNNKKIYFQLLLELFNKMGDDNMIPPLVANTLEWVKDSTENNKKK